jgi:hypothetical protein
MIRLVRITTHETPLQTRFPFRYGIAALTEAPHLLLRVEAEVNGKPAVGVSADLLPPKWFTKNPDTTYEQDLPHLREVIQHAADAAVALGPCESVFELWRRIYAAQSQWAKQTPHPPLLWHFGVSLVERAAIDAFCRGGNIRFADAVPGNALGIDLSAIHPELQGRSPADLLPAQPRRRVIVRHTVGLGDPLTDAEISPDERLDDGLPQSLEDSISAYGLTHFKIKLGGDADQDMDRLRRLAGLIVPMVGDRLRFSLDGNEQYRTIEPFRALWDRIVRDDRLREFMKGLLFVEQPIHRDAALSDETGAAMRDWRDRPPIILDESDATPASLPRALSLGYAGTSHKNCKGVFKGIASACLLAHRRAQRDDLVLSAEDLANVGPVALLQDLAVVATLGIGHVERNGHHYFRGLSGFPAEDQARTLRHHGDLFHRRGDLTTLAITGGELEIGSVVDAPFGCHEHPGG